MVVGSGFLAIGLWFVLVGVRLLIVGLWLLVGLVLLVVRLLLVLLPTAAVSWGAFSQKTTEVCWVLFIWALAIVSGVTCYLTLSASSFFDAFSKNPGPNRFRSRLS